MVDFVTRALVVAPRRRGSFTLRDSDESSEDDEVLSEDDEGLSEDDQELSEEDIETRARFADIMFKRAASFANKQERERRESMFADYYDYDSDDNCQFTNEGDSD